MKQAAHWLSERLLFSEEDNYKLIHYVGCFIVPTHQRKCFFRPLIPENVSLERYLGTTRLIQFK